MNLRRFFCIVLAVALLCLSGCTAGQSPNEPSKTDPGTTSGTKPVTNPEPPPESDPENEEENESDKPDMNKPQSILFIGNSYTYTENVPAIFEQLAEAAGYTVEVTAITKGAYTLSQMADPGDTYGARVEAALIGAKEYDYVVLQEQSILPASENVGQFYTAVRDLAGRIRESGATPVLYATWSRANGSGKLTENGWTNESMTWKLAAAYAAIGEELDIQVAHVGLAFYDVHNGQSDINIYSSDKSHPSYAGSYLAAATLCTKIFGITPDTSNYAGALEADEALLLRQAAERAVVETPTIPDEYKTSSEGIGD